MSNINLKVLEIIIVCIIITLQVLSFFKTFNLIKSFKSIFATLQPNFLQTLYIPLSDLRTKSVLEILAHTAKFSDPYNLRDTSSETVLEKITI